MTSFRQLLLSIAAAAVAAALAGCSGSDASEPARTPPAEVVANDCRAPNALSSQRGCRPSTRAIATR